MYKLIRPLLFLLPPELSHKLCLTALNLLARLKLTRLFFPKVKDTPSNCMGLTFKNPLGIAAGLDKNGDYLPGLSSLGVSFIEVGGVTPLAQPGNPKPRLHRLVADNAIINWMGLNNKGIDYLVKNLKNYTGDALIAVNLAKNAHTANEHAEKDYIVCLEKVFPYADFIVINISCPNSNAVDALQQETLLKRMLEKIMQRRQELQKQYYRKMPMLIKISPDLTPENIRFMVALAQQCKLDGIVAVNTSNKRNHLKETAKIDVKGGLSGAPLTATAEEFLTIIKKLAPQLTVISIGGIMSAADAEKRLQLGADLIQVYTGLIYEGPSLISKVLK